MISRKKGSCPSFLTEFGWRIEAKDGDFLRVSFAGVHNAELTGMTKDPSDFRNERFKA